MHSADEIIHLLGLVPLQGEGGYYAETYRSAGQVPNSALPPEYQEGSRSFGTAIYFLLTNEADSFSALHRLKGDEIYHFYLGDPVELLLLEGPGSFRRVTLGPELERGQHVQFTVPAGAWQGSRLLARGEFALLGTTMAPGFDARDFELGSREELTRVYPDLRAEIERLTR
jgi:uncharacterized protein